jgi:hypothetical protein
VKRHTGLCRFDDMAALAVLGNCEADGAHDQCHGVRADMRVSVCLRQDPEASEASGANVLTGSASGKDWLD